MKFPVGNLHTGRIDRYLQLHSAPPKGIQGDLKGPKLKIESDH